MMLAIHSRLIPCIVLLFVADNVMGEMYDPPRIEDLDELMRHKGGTLNITCTGEMAISWTYPDNRHQVPGISERLVIVDNTPDEGELFRSTLVVSQLMFADTGEFICMYTNQSMSHLVLSSTKDSLYLFVKDPDNLFVPYETMPGPIFLGIIHGQPAVVPCKVTNPKADVSFVSMTGREVELDESFTYNPKKGFQIFYPNVFFGNTFRCFAQTNQSSKIVLVVMTYFPATKPPTPEIEMKSARISTGETLSLRCFVIVQQGHFIALTWTIPADETSSRVDLSDLIRIPHQTSGYSYDKIQIDITVRDVRLSDTGEYMCTAQGADKQTQKSHKVITVLDEEYVKLTAEKAMVEVRRDEDSEATLIVSVNAHPEPELTWYFEEKPIDFTNIDKYEYLYNQEKRASLTVKNPGPEDAGTYKLNGVIPGNGQIQDTAVVHLYVKEPPMVKVVTPKGHPFYQQGRYAILACEVHGFPPPSIYWEWYSCDQLGCEVMDNSWKQHTESKNNPTISQSGHWSNLTLAAWESGCFRCVGRNEEGHDDVKKNFFVTEISNGFGLTNISSGGNRVAVEGDNVSLECVSQKYVYKAPQFYLRRSNDDMLLTNDSTSYRLKLNETDHSHKLSLMFMNVQRRTNANVYICKTTNKGGSQVTAEVKIVVKPAVAPKFTNPLKGTIYLEPDTSHPLTCQADGTPAPSYRWYQDARPFNESDSAKLSLNNRVLTLQSKEEAEHDYTCEAYNRAGSVNSSVHVVVRVGGPTSDGTTAPEKLSKAQVIVIVVVVLGLLLVIIFVALIARKCCPPKYIPIEQYLKPTDNYIFNPDIPLDEQTDVLGYDPKWEFPREKMEFGMMLGQGAFGKVMKAEADGIDGTDRKIPVAVKMVKDYTDREQVKALLSELKVLIHIGQHLNILNLLGAVTKDSHKGIFYVIVEYCKYGSLRSFMLKKRGDFIDTMDDYKKIKAMEKRQEADAGASSLNYMNSPGDSTSSDSGTSSTPPLTTKDLVCYSFQIARGMEYLSNRKYIHRDLAARNILLAEDNVVKICDFGLAKDCYKYGAEYKKKSSGPVPVKWMAIESLTHRIYTTKSDVWSFGILLWEIFTVGGTPYPAIDIDETFIERIKTGYRMQKPKYAPESVYDMMNVCWDADPDNRPSFEDLAQWFGDLLHDSVREHYLDLSNLYSTKAGASNIEPNGYLRMAGSNYIPMSPSVLGPPVYDTDLQHNVPTGDGDDNEDESSGGAAAVTIGDDDTVHYTTPQIPAQSVDYSLPQLPQLQTVTEEDEEEEEEQQPLLRKPTPTPRQQQQVNTTPTNGGLNGACAVVDMSNADNVDGAGGSQDPFLPNDKPPNGTVALRPKQAKPPPKYDKMHCQSESEEYSAPPTYSVVMTGYTPTEEDV